MEMPLLRNDRASWLAGPSAHCSVSPIQPARTQRVVLLGAPGVGKGTQAELLCKRLGGACHLSTGDIFRAAKSLPEIDRTPAMSSAVQYMQRGDLVPDSIVLDLLRERAGCLTCLGGFVLDGFPRTVNQALALQDLLRSIDVDLDSVIDYELPLDEIVSRLSGRRTCGKCKSVFHVTTRPPVVANVCDHCGGSLIQREDDRPESIRVRMRAYHDQTAPLIEFYRKRKLLMTVDAHGTPDEILGRTVAAFSVGLRREV